MTLPKFQPNGKPWNDPGNLAADPDHGWTVTQGSTAEAAVASALNTLFKQLELVRPPDSGLGDFVGRHGGGRHFDHKTLPRRNNLLDDAYRNALENFWEKNVHPTLEGPYWPLVIIDSSDHETSERAFSTGILSGLAQQSQKTDRIIWWGGQGGQVPTLPPGADQEWDGPQQSEDYMADFQN